jgi:hypothetical protein
VALKEIQSAIPNYDAISNIAASHSEIAEASDAIWQMADAVLVESDLSDRLDFRRSCKNFHHYGSTAVLRCTLHRWLSNRGIAVKKSEFEKLLIAARDGGDVTVNAIEGTKITASHGVVTTCGSRKIENLNFNFDGWVCGSLLLPNGHVLSRKLCKLNNSDLALFGHSREKCAYVSCNDDDDLSVRNFDPNIKYTCFGHDSSKKLGAILGQNAKKYCDKPVIFSNGIPCWVPGLSSANTFKIKEDSPHALLLTYS